MLTYVVSSGKVKDQYRPKTRNSSFSQLSSSRRWAKGAATFSTITSDALHSGDIVTGFKNMEYVNTISHIPLNKRKFAGGDYIGLSGVQNEVVNYLSDNTKINKIFLQHQASKDTYIVIIDQDYPMFSLELSNLYWDLFDRFQDTVSSYSFEFEYFNDDEITNQTEGLKVMYVRGQ